MGRGFGITKLRPNPFAVEEELYLIYISTMALKKKTQKEQAEQKEIRSLSKIFLSRGIEVRRENLSRGHSFRVKSGNCEFSGKQLLFIDRRLPTEQQLSLLVDSAVDEKLKLAEEEVSGLSSGTLKLLGLDKAA